MRAAVCEIGPDGLASLANCKRVARGGEGPWSGPDCLPFGDGNPGGAGEPVTMVDIRSLRVLTSSASLTTASSGGGALGGVAKPAVAVGAVQSAASELFSGDEDALSACDSHSSPSSAPSVSESAIDSKKPGMTSGP